jgi:hypothetical protein
MKSSGAAAHDALIAFLRAAPAVTALVGQRVYDRAPQDVPFPYVTLGLSRTDRFRVQGSDGCSLFCEVNGWTRTTSGEWTCDPTARQFVPASARHASAPAAPAPGLSPVPAVPPGLDVS